jgi:hypothetical protein
VTISTPGNSDSYCHFVRRQSWQSCVGSNFTEQHIQVSSFVYVTRNLGLVFRLWAVFFTSVLLQILCRSVATSCCDLNCGLYFHVTSEKCTRGTIIETQKLFFFMIQSSFFYLHKRGQLFGQFIMLLSDRCSLTILCTSIIVPNYSTVGAWSWSLTST